MGAARVGMEEATFEEGGEVWAERLVMREREDLL